MRNLMIFLCSLAGAVSLFGGADLDPAKKKVEAVNTHQRIQIDGSLDEPDWLSARPATDFLQHEPHPGQKPAQTTEVRILFDDTGIYIGAYLYDTQPDSILKELSQRDNFGNTDWFGLFIDAYRDGINGFGFIVTPANVQFDAKYSTYGEDESWDAVWESATRITSEGWVAELKIPYSAIRFPRTDEQVWHTNFGRMIRRLQQKCFWSNVDPQQNGFFNQAGYLTGIRDVSSPVRLQATPFIAAYVEQLHDPSGRPANSYGRSFNGGMDIKYGINDAFTLDMTLIPDFGEARSDNQVLNLSPFEVRFDENRQFFTEGTELFNKGNLFYSRRIGGMPLHYGEVEEQLREGEQILENPLQTQLFNATKISGRTSGGLGLGFFNATAGRTLARIGNSENVVREVQTSPLTNYNVLVLDQNLPHNSFATLINTTVLRSGGDFDANVTGTVFELRNRANSYSVSGKAVLTQQYLSGGQTNLGHSYNVTLRKTSGNFQWGTQYNVESDKYDPNDLGFIFNNNERSWQGWVEYGKYQPFWKFNRAFVGAWTRYSRLYQPDVFTDYGLNLWGSVQTQGFWRISVFTFHEPFVTYDYFEPRTPGRFYRYPTSNNFGFFISSDSRKRLQAGVEVSRRTWSQEGRHQWSLEFSPRFRFSDRFNLGLGLDITSFANDEGFADTRMGSNGSGEKTEVIFGRRDRNIVENEINANYTFNSNMALSFRLRHYWAKVEYRSYHRLGEDGGLLPTDYDQRRDQDFDAFNIDMIYRWRFAPGSDLYIIWKNAVFGASDIPSADYFRNINSLFDHPVSNSLSLKVVYFLDYFNLTHRKEG